MKAIDILKEHKSGLLDTLNIEIRANNWTQKYVRYDCKEVLNDEPILQHELIDWFINCDDSIITFVINVEE